MDSVDSLEQTRVDKEEEAAVSPETQEKNKALVRRFLEGVHTKGDLDIIDELLSSDFVDRSLMPGQEGDREGYKRSMAEIMAPWSHTRLIIEDQIAEGNKVLTRITLRGIHDRGEFLGMAPTGKEWVLTSMMVHRIGGGKIVEEWSEGSTDPWQERLDEEMRERERIDQELRVAHRIQQASLPKEVLTLEGWQITPYYQPAREVGGDFYEFFVLDDGRVGLAVGDATGKGVPAAFVMSATSALLGGVATASGSSPGEVLSRVNEAVLTRIPPNMFVTCFYAILEPETGRLVYANAGHNLPCCRHEGTTSELSARGMPLGLMPGMSYEENETILAPGESVLLYTDGLTEAHNPEGEMFGTPRLRRLLSEHPLGGADLNVTLLEALRHFTGEELEQEDDITLLALKCFPTQS